MHYKIAATPDVKEWKWMDYKNLHMHPSSHAVPNISAVPHLVEHYWVGAP